MFWSEKRNRDRKKSLEVWESQEIRMYCVCPCHSNTRKACSQCQREERERRWDHFSHEAPAARTPTLTFSESAREREREKGGVREAEKVEWSLISSLSQKERRQWLKRLKKESKKKKGPRERYYVSAIRVEQQEVFFMVQKSRCSFEVSSKFHCDSRGHSEVVNGKESRDKIHWKYQGVP